MQASPSRAAALQQLTSVPGVVGGLLFGRAGAVVASAFPPVFDAAGLGRLAGQLAADAYFQEWLRGDAACLDLRYADGHVVVRPVDDAWLLVLCTAQANEQLLAMSLTQLVRRLRTPEAAPPSPLERLRAVAGAELGEHSAQALEILASAGTSRGELERAAEAVEKLTRMFISKKKAEELGRRMREIIEA